jgi:hypothetical protein
VKVTTTTTDWLCDLQHHAVASAHQAVETVAFTYQGKRYRVDLCADDLAEFNRWMATLTQARPSQRSSRARSAPGRREAKALRQWAAENGYHLEPRGRIPAAIRRAYEDRKERAA